MKNLWKSSWWITFTASLVATVLGIALTFGVSQHIDSTRQKKFLRTSKLMAMTEIRREINLKAEAYDDYLHPASEAIAEMTKLRTADSLKYLSEDVVKNIGMFLLIKYVDADIHSTEKMFHSSSEMWKYESNYAEIDAINMLFAYINQLQSHMDMFYKEISWIKETHFDEVYSIFSGRDSLKGLNALFRDKKVMFSLESFAPVFVELFEEEMKDTKLLYDMTMEQLGFTESDLDAYELTIEEDDEEAEGEAEDGETGSEEEDSEDGEK